MYSVTERLSRIISRDDLPEEVVNELVAVVDDLETIVSDSVSDLETTFSINTNQMRFNYDY